MDKSEDFLVAILPLLQDDEEDQTHFQHPPKPTTPIDFSNLNCENCCSDESIDPCLADRPSWNQSIDPCLADRPPWDNYGNFKPETADGSCNYPSNFLKCRLEQYLQNYRNQVYARFSPTKIIVDDKGYLLCQSKQKRPLWGFPTNQWDIDAMNGKRQYKQLFSGPPRTPLPTFFQPLTSSLVETCKQDDKEFAESEPLSIPYSCRCRCCPCQCPPRVTTREYRGIRPKGTPFTAEPPTEEDPLIKMLMEQTQVVFNEFLAKKIPIIWIYGRPQKSVATVRRNYCLSLAETHGFTYISLDEEIALLAAKGSRAIRAGNPFFEGFSAIERLAIPVCIKLVTDPKYSLDRFEAMEMLKFLMLQYFPTNGYIIDGFPWDSIDNEEFERTFYPVTCGLYFLDASWTTNKAELPEVIPPLYFRRNQDYDENEVEEACGNFGLKTLKIIGAEQLLDDEEKIFALHAVVDEYLEAYDEVLEGNEDVLRDVNLEYQTFGETVGYGLDLAEYIKRKPDEDLQQGSAMEPQKHFIELENLKALGWKGDTDLSKFSSTLFDLDQLRVVPSQKMLSPEEDYEGKGKHRRRKHRKHRRDSDESIVCVDGEPCPEKKKRRHRGHGRKHRCKCRCKCRHNRHRGGRRGSEDYGGVSDEEFPAKGRPSDTGRHSRSQKGRRGTNDEYYVGDNDEDFPTKRRPSGTGRHSRLPKGRHGKNEEDFVGDNDENFPTKRRPSDTGRQPGTQKGRRGTNDEYYGGDNDEDFPTKRRPSGTGHDSRAPLGRRGRNDEGYGGVNDGDEDFPAKRRPSGTGHHSRAPIGRRGRNEKGYGRDNDDNEDFPAKQRPSGIGHHSRSPKERRGRNDEDYGGYNDGDEDFSAKGRPSDIRHHSRPPKERHGRNDEDLGGYNDGHENFPAKQRPSDTRQHSRSPKGRRGRNDEDYGGDNDGDEGFPEQRRPSDPRHRSRPPKERRGRNGEDYGGYNDYDEDFPSKQRPSDTRHHSRPPKGRRDRVDDDYGGDNDGDVDFPSKGRPSDTRHNSRQLKGRRGRDDVDYGGVNDGYEDVPAKQRISVTGHHSRSPKEIRGRNGEDYDGYNDGDEDFLAKRHPSGSTQYVRAPKERRGRNGEDYGGDDDADGDFPVKRHPSETRHHSRPPKERRGRNDEDYGGYNDGDEDFSAKGRPSDTRHHSRPPKGRRGRNGEDYGGDNDGDEDFPAKQRPSDSRHHSRPPKERRGTDDEDFSSEVPEDYAGHKTKSKPITKIAEKRIGKRRGKPGGSESEMDVDMDPSGPFTEDKRWGFRSTKRLGKHPTVHIPRLSTSHRKTDLTTREGEIDKIAREGTAVYALTSLQTHGIPDPYNTIPHKSEQKPGDYLHDFPGPSAPDRFSKINRTETQSENARSATTAYTPEPTSGLRSLFSDSISRVLAKNQADIRSIKYEKLKQKVGQVEYEIYQDDYRSPKYRFYKKYQDYTPEDFVREKENNVPCANCFDSFKQADQFNKGDKVKNLSHLKHERNEAKEEKAHQYGKGPLFNRIISCLCGEDNEAGFTIPGYKPEPKKEDNADLEHFDETPDYRKKKE